MSVKTLVFETSASTNSAIRAFILFFPASTTAVMVSLPNHGHLFYSSPASATAVMVSPELACLSVTALAKRGRRGRTTGIKRNAKLLKIQRWKQGLEKRPHLGPSGMYGLLTLG